MYKFRLEMEIENIYFHIFVVGLFSISCASVHKSAKRESQDVLIKNEQKDMDKINEEEKKVIELELIKLRGQGIAGDESLEEISDLKEENKQLANTNQKSGNKENEKSFLNLLIF